MEFSKCPISQFMHLTIGIFKDHACNCLQSNWFQATVLSDCSVIQVSDYGTADKSPTSFPRLTTSTVESLIQRVAASQCFL